MNLTLTFALNSGLREVGHPTGTAVLPHSCALTLTLGLWSDGSISRDLAPKSQQV